MSPLIIFNISFVFVFYPMFISDYHRKAPYFLSLTLFMINALVVLYDFFHYFGLF